MNLINYDLWKGIESGYPLCCVFFFWCFWTDVRAKKLMFSYKESHDWSTNIGYIECPDCILRRVK